MEYTQAFLNKIRKVEGPSAGLSVLQFKGEKINNKKYIGNIEVTSISFTDDEMKNYSFKNCKFKHCSFYGVQLSLVQFINCEFKNSVFFNCDFDTADMIESIFSTVTFESSNFEASNLINCSFIEHTIFTGVKINTTAFIDTNFIECSLNRVDFSGQINKVDLTTYIQFTKCDLFKTTFFHHNFSKIRFRKCKLIYCTFSHSVFDSNTFELGNTTVDDCFNSVDFYTIQNSSILKEDTLTNLFGIHNQNIREYISEMLIKMEFQTVFISYSFNDVEFAKKINQALLSKGVFTFLWEQDAPGGRRLKKIMIDNVNKLDRVLFISSKESLKSEACHFELMEGRKKYTKTWEEVLFPIHIDNYLFAIQEFDIPRKNRELFWDNILELREINSKDFSKYTSNNYDKLEYDKLIMSLVSDLRKKKQ